MLTFDRILRTVPSLFYPDTVHLDSSTPFEASRTSSEANRPIVPLRLATLSERQCRFVCSPPREGRLVSVPRLELAASHRGGGPDDWPVCEPGEGSPSNRGFMIALLSCLLLGARKFC